MRTAWATRAVLIAALVPVGITACGGSDKSSDAGAAAKTSSATPTPEPAAARGAATVEIRESRLGRILVDESGHSLYSFTQDKARRSVCTSDFLNCPTMWPPLTTTGRPHATGGAKAALLGTIRRTKPAGRQVTYNGHPVYRYIDDARAGDLEGQGLYDYWYVLSPAGGPITGK